MKTRLLILSISALAVARAGIINGGFETGNFQGWTVSGNTANGQVLISSDTGDALKPAEGAFFAILSTGPGIVTCCERDETILTSAPYVVQNKSAMLSFTYDFLTSENNDGTGAPSTFSASILGKTAKKILEGTVKDGYPKDLIVPGGFVALPDGTALIFHTGQIALSSSLSDFAGQTVRFEFRVSDGDPADATDSALYLDKISATNVTAAPEPATGSLALLALCVVLLFRSARARPSAT
jgi:hypothetical protein